MSIGVIRLNNVNKGKIPYSTLFKLYSTLIHSYSTLSHPTDILITTISPLFHLQPFCPYSPLFNFIPHINHHNFTLIQPYPTPYIIITILPLSTIIPPTDILITTISPLLHTPCISPEFVLLFAA